MNDRSMTDLFPTAPLSPSRVPLSVVEVSSCGEDALVKHGEHDGMYGGTP